MLGLIGRALQMGGETGKSFFGPAFDVAFYAVRNFLLEYVIRRGGAEQLDPALAFKLPSKLEIEIW